MLKKFKLITKNKLLSLKNKISEEKKRPRSKLKLYVLRLETVLTIFGLTCFGFPANASDYTEPNSSSVPNPYKQPLPTPSKRSDQILRTLRDAAGTICRLTLTSGLVLVGIGCSIVYSRRYS